MDWLKRPPRILVGVSLLWLAAIIVAFSDAGVPFPTWLALSGALVGLGLVWIVRLAIAFLTVRAGRRLIWQQWPYWICTPAILLAGLLLAASPMLLAARVYLSANSLTNSVSLDSKENRWIGLFYVREFSQFDKELRFLTNECGLLDMCGIVFSPNGRPPNRGEDSF